MRIPTATYRLQFNADFGFQAAAPVISYLADLGVSDVYASPVFQARKASRHGYDITDTNQLNPELGDTSDFETLMGMVKAYRMGWLQDIVPNHMAFDHGNALLMDVLENGSQSAYYNFFDIDWDHPAENMRGRLLAPFLGRPYGESLENGEIKLKYDDAGFSIQYYRQRFPVKIETFAAILADLLAEFEKRPENERPIFTTLQNLWPRLNALYNKKMDALRKRQLHFIKSALWDLYCNRQPFRQLVEKTLRAYNGRKGFPESFKALDRLLSQQIYRLAYWKVAAAEINYRRFFDINELIALRVENEAVFNYTHDLIFMLSRKKQFSGLRIDHIDGLYDPAAYLRKLREKAGDIYIVVEKILGPEEPLAQDWPVQGATGYEFGAVLNAVFCRRAHAHRFEKTYAEFTGPDTTGPDILREIKQRVLTQQMGGDIDNLARLMKQIAGAFRHGADMTPNRLKRALAGALTQLPVYRTYIVPEGAGALDRKLIQACIQRASRDNPDLAPELALIRHVLLLHYEKALPGKNAAGFDKKLWIRTAMKFQQLSSALMAKGYEDTFFYVYNRLISLNEVGASPERFGCRRRMFHDFNTTRARCWPHGLNTTATHDTKRGEDVRARINVLSELPGEWKRAIDRWHAINRGRKKMVNRAPVPDKNEEYFLYQTLIGAFPFYDRELPLFIERMKAYVVKAAREAKVNTAWLTPNSAYEEALAAFAGEVLSPGEENLFLRDFLPFQQKVTWYGILNSLSQVLIKITAPGVPDFYQGAELWDLNLVDPDNRRAVDFDNRRTFLEKTDKKAVSDPLGLIGDLLSDPGDGKLKLFLISTALRARNRYHTVFGSGTYLPLSVFGKYRQHVLAFARSDGSTSSVTVAPRFFTGLARVGKFPLGIPIWQDTEVFLPEGHSEYWEDVFTRETVSARTSLRIAEILKHFPVSMLINKRRSTP